VIKHKISYQDTKLFSTLVVDYLNENEEVSSFINHFPTVESFKKQIEEKKKSDTNRSVLVDVLKHQNSTFALSDKSTTNLDLLKLKNTFTITTGHQLCLFTGPLYFIYKIISTINLTEELIKEYPENNFVPIFWMASEDHDFEEVNHINLFGEKIVWDSNQKGAVGKMSTESLKDIFIELRQVLGNSENAKKILSLFENAYQNHATLSDSTRYLVNELFGKYGIVIIDGDNKQLKNVFSPFIKRDILEKSNFHSLKYCSDKLSQKYNLQAFVREVNFFRISEEKRERIEGGVSEEEIDNNIEIFSPNVLMRPLYQEYILPNLAYIGGGAEIAYWMQIREMFKKEEVCFPLLILRNSSMWIEEKDFTKFISLGFELKDLFCSENELHNKFIKKQSSISLDFEKIKIEKLYQGISDKTSDVGMVSSIHSELKKQLKSFSKLEKKLLKSEKQNHETSLNQISKIKNKLFPKNSLQERFENIIPFYLTYGEKFIETLKEELNPLDTNFLILSPQKNKQ